MRIAKERVLHATENLDSVDLGDWDHIDLQRV